MRAYTVHAPPDDPSAPERFAFVKDGFSWPALFVPLLWILWHRLWLVLIGYLVYLAALAGIGQLAGEGNATIIGLLGAILFALEANNLRRWSLRRRSWREVGGSFGQNLDEAEARFFSTWGRESDRPRRTVTVARTAARTADGDEQQVL